MPPSPTPVRRRRRALFFAALAIVVGAVSLVILEVGVRLFAPQPASWLAIYQRHPRLPFFALMPNAHAVVDTGETSWEAWTDEQGYRVAKGAALPDLPRVVWFGDSFTFGHGVDYEQTWIGKLAARPGVPCRHENRGVIGYGPQQYLAVLEDMLREKPRVARVCVATFVGNDFHDSIWSKDTPTQNGVLGDDGSWKGMLKRNLHSYRLASRVSHRLSGRSLPEEAVIADLRDPARWLQSPLREAQGNYRDAFAAIAKVCSEHSIPLTVVVIPTASMVALTRERGAATTVDVPDERGMVPRATTLLRELGIHVVDATAALATYDPAELYFRFDQHFTPRGHDVMAELLLRAIPNLGS